MARNKVKGIELSVFKGRKADLTHAILQILAKETLVKYDVHKTLIKQGFKDTRYGTVKNRIRILEETGYLREAGLRKTQPGSEGILYEATFKALAALKLHTTNLEDLFKCMDEKSAVELLALLTRRQS
jgi:DNA-binding PadR family transcriptional regulator